MIMFESWQLWRYEMINDNKYDSHSNADIDNIDNIDNIVT
jgi:hypothetical protein